MKVAFKNKLRNIISTMLIIPIALSATGAENGEIIKQIIDGHTLEEVNVHGSKMRVLQSNAFEQYQAQYLRNTLKEQILKEAKPYIELEDKLKARVANGDESQELQTQLYEVSERLKEIKSKDNVLQQYQALSDQEKTRESNFCYDINQTTLRVMSNNSPSINCIKNESADNIVKVALSNPAAAKKLNFEITSAKKKSPKIEVRQPTPLERGKKRYYCYDRDQSILSKQNKCKPQRYWFTDKEVEEFGKSKCYPISKSYTYKEEDGFTPTMKLYGKCLDEVCTVANEQINYSDFELVSFSQTSKYQCEPDGSSSRVCAQTYHCKNKTYQVTCEFNEEEYTGSNTCNVNSINEETMKNNCKVIELGTEV